MPEKYKLGPSNIETEFEYDSHNRVTGIVTENVQDMEYTYDQNSGNMLSRQDNIHSQTETFSYTSLNRLNEIEVTSILGCTNTITYSNNGNINHKTDAGDYTYDQTKKHALTNIANNPTTIPTNQQNVSYTPFNKVNEITQSNNSLSYTYGPDGQRKISQLFKGGVLKIKKTYSLNYEKVYTSLPNNTKTIHYIYGAYGLAAVYIVNSSQTLYDGFMYYVCKDHLGSITHLVDDNCALQEELSYDAWGRRRIPYSWCNYNVSTTHIIDRGFTQHEHLDTFGIINMNGRVYDPIVGRFLSPDPIIQNPFNSQNFNLFSYVLNNPLSLIDPSGYGYSDGKLYYLKGPLDVVTIYARRYNNSGVMFSNMDGTGNVFYSMMPLTGIIEDIFIGDGDVIGFRGGFGGGANGSTIYRSGGWQNIVYYNPLGNAKKNKEEIDKKLVKKDLQSLGDKNGVAISVANGAVAAGPGIMFDIGAVFDSHGNSSLYFTVGGLIGVGASAGIGISRTSSNFSIVDFKGVSEGILLQVPLRTQVLRNISIEAFGNLSDDGLYRGDKYYGGSINVGVGGIYAGYHSYTFLFNPPNEDFWCRSCRR